MSTSASKKEHLCLRIFNILIYFIFKLNLQTTKSFTVQTEEKANIKTTSGRVTEQRAKFVPS